MKLNAAVWEAEQTLIALINRIKEIQMKAYTTGNDTARDASQQLDQVACQLAEVQGNLPDVFVDIFRDEKDQSYRIDL